MVRGTVNLPHGTGKTKRVLVFATGDKAAAAEAAGADFVGADDLIDKVKDGWVDYDAVVAAPELMGKVGHVGKGPPGPRGLVPNPRTGTVTGRRGRRLKRSRAEKIEFRVDKHANLQFVIGKASFDAQQLIDNYAAALDEILRLKPERQGTYLKKIVVSTSQGPGVGLIRQLRASLCSSYRATED